MQSTTKAAQRFVDYCVFHFYKSGLVSTMDFNKFNFDRNKYMG